MAVALSAGSKLVPGGIDRWWWGGGGGGCREEGGNTLLSSAVCLLLLAAPESDGRRGERNWFGTTTKCFGCQWACDGGWGVCVNECGCWGGGAVEPHGDVIHGATGMFQTYEQQFSVESLIFSNCQSFRQSFSS